MTGQPLILNRIMTPDGTILTSYHRHDYVTYKDANGEIYMVDGGTDYLRRSAGHEEPPTELSQYYDPNDHEHNRQHFHWGTRGPLGDQPLSWRALEHMTTDHIAAVLETQPHVKGHVRSMFEEELRLRILYS